MARFRARVIYTTFIDKVVEADTPEQAAERAWCITGDSDAYQNNLDNAQTEVEQVSETEQLTESEQKLLNLCQAAEAEGLGDIVINAD